MIGFVVFVALLAGVAHAEEGLTATSESGPVSVTVRVTPALPVIGDAIELEIEARAEAGVELLMPAFGQALGRFRVTSFVPTEQVDATGATVARQRYGLQSSRSGRQSLPPLMVDYGGFAARVSDIMDSHEDHARKQLAELAPQLGSDVTVAVTAGVPHIEIVRLAEQRQADIVVMATHGRGFVSHAILGSTTERVVRRAPCPVLSVRADGAMKGE